MRNDDYSKPIYSTSETHRAVSIDNSITPIVKILTEGKAKEMVLQALEDVRAEIHEAGILDHHSDEIEVALVYGKVETIIDNKIAEVKGDKEYEVEVPTVEPQKIDSELPPMGGFHS